MTTINDKNVIHKKLSPFLKWPGGKRWLLPKLKNVSAPDNGKYIEPFLGSGALFFQLQPKKAVLTDINKDLINLYLTIRDNSNKLKTNLKTHHDRHCFEYFYKIRNEKFDDPIQQAARFLYLNRTCWNGLYRVNLKGEFNVPIGTKKSVILPTDDFDRVSKILENQHIAACDFETSINMASAGDLLFVDPPYTVKHNFNGFVKYNEKIFSWEDQIRLRDCLKLAIDRGATAIITNANHPSVRKLYGELGRIEVLDRYSVLAGKSEFRSKITEIIVHAPAS